MSSTHQLRIRLPEPTYARVMAEAERRETDPSSVIESCLNTVRIAERGSERIYGAVLAMKTLLNRMEAQARLQGIDLKAMGLPVASLADQLNALHRLILELNDVDLDLDPQADLEPLTLERELRLEIEHERFLGQDDVG
ncbi:hypothetical protein GFS31_41420 (plasmid) [Leptolyngbya sp. BL0902]|uniref:hypothetical protein n=1 Tax=Leptolyngbya sp. BL0902 TaxID=1115757 RepID=UPI0018E83D01|nr:hypothetical protein [Leptolyngbya sp. BL0902]QQE67429.1 hypothetical protein GFS31_41420 [Leptolyngbya sp. BL0902]